MSIPNSAATRVSASTSGGSVAGGGISSRSAGVPTVRMKASKPAGSVTSRKRACSELTRNVWGTPLGPNTNVPAGATVTSPPTQKVISQVETGEQPQWSVGHDAPGG